MTGRILTLVPARGGSKRVPRKNVLPLGGLPLIGWTLLTARSSRCCGDVVVSTDDPEIADVAGRYGAVLPGLRPDELSGDTAGSVDVALFELDRFEQAHGAVDALVLLQPTSPFRGTASIERAVEIFFAHGGARPVVSVAPVSVHPAWTFRITEQGMDPVLGWEALSSRSQDLEPMWALNGAVYVISPSRLRADRRFLTPDVLPLRMSDPMESVDIDTWEDWRSAEELVRQGKVRAPNV
ncbi:acylneuraminate cytidylyltransferase family protein [Bordetella hinzii]|uniref:acylneuraminate cytidylyltransferase family protein n=1 Tax=Bordetella hinzii TaxID=103855 RepID=UPI002A188747|nr:acylneuraminate cytidylyltransferase family protein [Bordetella hinzii]WPL82071.1 acylneuraminate cytidylyltransferase family protein [Bordetella hinzii]